MTRPKTLGAAPALLLEGGALYTPGAGGALTGPESALSCLPSCPCEPFPFAGAGPARRSEILIPCGLPARPIGGRDMRCGSGHVFAGTRAEHEQARGAPASG